MTAPAQRTTAPRRKLLGLAVVGFWLVMTALLVYRDVLGGSLRSEVVLSDATWIEEPVETWLSITTAAPGSAQRLAQEATSTPPSSSTDFSGSTEKPRRVGWARIRQAPESRDAVEGARMDAEVHLQLNLLGRATSLDMNGMVWRARRLKQAEIDFRVVSGEAEFALVGSILGDRLRAQVLSGGEAQPFDVRLPDNALFSTGFGTALSFPPLKPGEETVIQTFDPMTLRPTRSRVRAVSRGQVEVGGETIEAVRLRVQASGMDTVAWIDDNGQVIRAETPLGLHLQKATREEALAPIGDDPNAGELLRITAVRPTGPQPTRGVSTLVATLRSSDERPLMIGTRSGDASLDEGDLAMLTVPSDFRQHTASRFETSDGDRLLLLSGDPSSDVAPEEAADADVPSAEDLAALLATDPFIATDHPRIKAQADAILEEAKAPRDQTPSSRRAQAVALHDWTFRSIEKVPVLSLPSALEVLESLRGDCNEHTILYAALARSVGLPTRVAIGLVWSDELRGFYYHAWPEIWLGDRWLATDPTLGQRVADATHIKLLEGGIERWPQLLPFLGKLEIELHTIDSN